MTVVFSEPLHHICLMNGLKKTYGRMPFLNKRVLEVRGKVVTTDNVIAPPPMMSRHWKEDSQKFTEIWQ